MTNFKPLPLMEGEIFVCQIMKADCNILRDFSFCIIG